MRLRRLALALMLAAPFGCKKPATRENKDPYRDVTPQKVKDRVEDIQKKEDQQNEKRMEQMK